jgi:hypothetical protein
VRAASAAIPKGTAKAAMDDELLVYLVEKQPELPLVKPLIAVIRAYLFRMGPVDNPPCIRQRPFLGAHRYSSQAARAWQGCPSRQRAPQRGSSCLNTLWGLVFSGFMSLLTP